MNELKIPTNLETISLNEQNNYRLIEIKYEQLLASKLSKYLTGFDYADKILTISLTVFSGKNIFAHVKEEKQLLGLITSVFSLFFFLVLVLLKNHNKTQKQERKNTTNYCIWLKTNLIVLKC